jgi:hypothetical protein
MNKRILSPTLVLLFALQLFFSGCVIFRKADSGELKERSSKYLMKRLIQNQVAADWFSAKARITYQDKNETVKLTSYVRMRKDSVIWMNFKKLSIEAARLLMTPDSMVILNRMDKEYTVKDYQFVQQNFRIPANFSGLQSFLLGNPLFFSADLEAGVESPYYLLKDQTSNYPSSYYLDGLSYWLSKVIIEDRSENRNVELTLADYKQLEDEQNFSYFRSLTFQSEELGEVEIDIEFSKVELNVPKTIKFEIPDRYTRID